MIPFSSKPEFIYRRPHASQMGRKLRKHWESKHCSACVHRLRISTLTYLGEAENNLQFLPAENSF